MENEKLTLDEMIEFVTRYTHLLRVEVEKLDKDERDAVNWVFVRDMRHALIKAFGALHMVQVDKKGRAE